MKRVWLAAIAIAVALAPGTALANGGGDLWGAFDRTLGSAKYIDLSHRLTPQIPVWKGFGPSVFEPAVDPATGQAYTYAQSGFEATAYHLSTDQFGTQLDPPAHWAPEYRPSTSCHRRSRSAS